MTFVVAAVVFCCNCGEKAQLAEALAPSIEQLRKDYGHMRFRNTCDRTLHYKHTASNWPEKFSGLAHDLAGGKSVQPALREAKGVCGGYKCCSKQASKLE